MRNILVPLLLTMLVNSAIAAERKSVFPPASKPVGPYSPGISTGNYLYVSGQGARDAAGNLPETVEGQTRNCLTNIKTIVEAAGLTMDNIVYTHTYLVDIKSYDEMNRAYARFFSGVLPARSTMGVVRMPLDTPVEISAIAIVDKAKREPLLLPGAQSGVPLSPGILTPDRFFLSGILGRESGAASKTSDSMEEQIRIALRRLDGTLRAAHLTQSHLVHIAAYRTSTMPRSLVESALRKAAPDAVVSLVDVNSLPFGVSVGITGVAVRDLKQKRIYREGNQKGGRALCGAAGETIYCAATEAANITIALSAISEGMKSLGSSVERAVANTVYIDDIENFKTMNSAYALAFPDPPPTRTTVQPTPPAPGIRVSVVGVK